MIPTIAPPNQADFALVTINDSEDQAVRDVFKTAYSPQNQLSGERGVFAWWQMGGALPSDRFIVVHASTCDAKGPLPAIELIRELDRRFKPRFLFLLGTAGGIREEKHIEYGRVVYSRQVHTGYARLLDLTRESGAPRTVEVTLRRPSAAPF
jgi:hypothetical protein